MRLRTRAGRDHGELASHKKGTSMIGPKRIAAWMVAALVGGAVVGGVTSQVLAADCSTGTLQPFGSKPSAAEPLEITAACQVGKGTYYYANVNIHSGGVLTFLDEKIEFWATGILIENQGKLIAGSPSEPI